MPASQNRDHGHNGPRNGGQDSGNHRNYSYHGAPAPDRNQGTDNNYEDRGPRRQNNGREDYGSLGTRGYDAHDGYESRGNRRHRGRDRRGRNNSNYRNSNNRDYRNSNNSDHCNSNNRDYHDSNTSDYDNSNTSDYRNSDHARAPSSRQWMDRKSIGTMLNAFRERSRNIRNSLSYNGLYSLIDRQVNDYGQVSARAIFNALGPHISYNGRQMSSRGNTIGSMSYKLDCVMGILESGGEIVDGAIADTLYNPGSKRENIAAEFDRMRKECADARSVILQLQKVARELRPENVRSAEAAAGGQWTTMCLICQDKLINGDKVATGLSACTSFYHETCLLTLIEYNKGNHDNTCLYECPCCRTRVNKYTSMIYDEDKMNSGRPDFRRETPGQLSAAQAREPPSNTDSEAPEAPICDNCQIAMESKHNHSGNLFWGCPNWRDTKCPPRSYNQPDDQNSTSGYCRPDDPNSTSRPDGPLCEHCKIPRESRKNRYGKLFWGCPNWRNTKCPPRPYDESCIGQPGQIRQASAISAPVPCANQPTLECEQGQIREPHLRTIENAIQRPSDSIGLRVESNDRYEEYSENDNSDFGSEDD